MASDHLEIRLESAHFPCDPIQVLRVTGREAISALFAFDVDVVCERGDEVDVCAMEGAEASIVFDRGGEIVRRVHGMVAEIDDLLDTEVEHRQLRLRLVPRAHRLTLVQTQEVFVDASVPEIIRKKLRLVDLGGPDDAELRLAGQYPKREMVVQYQETDLAFVSRLAEHLGISFFFEHAGDRDKIVFTDHAGGFPPVPGREAVAFHGRGAKQDVYRIEAKTRVIPRSYVMQDYNYRTPLVDLSGSAEAPSGLGGGVVEYGAHVKTVEDAERIARVRAEEREARHKVFTGESALPELFAGGVFTLEDHRHLGDVRLLVVAIEHDATQAAGMHGGQGDRAYRATFEAALASLPYRPPRVTAAPRIHGLVTAIVEPMTAGDESRFAKIDDHGRYTLRFLFDNADHGQHRPSHPIRMLQPHAGPGYGMHFPLKPGVEVLVAFVDGDPDRPLIVGAAPNPVTPSPVTGKNQTVHRISTETGIVVTMKDA